MEIQHIIIVQQSITKARSHILMFGRLAVVSNSMGFIRGSSNEKSLHLNAFIAIAMQCYIRAGITSYTVPHRTIPQ
jgi:hypothetical protein